MRKRLFTLLLAAALVLSMGTAQVTAGEMSGTEQTEQGADVSVQTPDEADAVGDDAPAGEPGEDDAFGDETGGPGEDDVLADGTGENDGDDGAADKTGAATADDGTADESGGDAGDDGETVPAAVNDMPVDDEPQTTADVPAAVSILFEGAEHITSLTADGADVLPDARAGTPIVLSADGESRVTLGMELEDGYTAGTDENSSDSVSFDGGMVEIRDDGDGSAVVQITARPQVMAIDASGSTVKITLVDADGYVTGVTDSNKSYDSSFDGSLSGSYELKQGDKLFLTGKACALDVEGGHVTEKRYSLNGVTGELSVTYFVEPDGTGDMTVTTRADDKAPTPIKIEYVDPENRIGKKDNYVLPGSSFSVEPGDDDNYTISVEGSVSSVTTYKNGSRKDCYMVQVNEDATSVTVTVMAAKAGAKLSATIPDAVESADLYGMSEIIEREYVGHNGTMVNGKGWFLLKNGYAVGPDVTGGSVWIYSIRSDEGTGSIHTCYTVDATADTVNVPIVEAQPYRWVDVKVDNDVGCNYSVRNVLPGVNTRSSSSKDEEYRWVVLDELTATLNASGYELEAVSGCTLRWEKNEYGKITYHIIPDEDGDTSVELQVIKADNQEPVLKAGTDTEEGVQTDKAAVDLLKEAIDVFAKGNVPVGMSQDTADKLRAALEEADAVTVPELSAVLRVKKENIPTIQGADAVYEIGIVLSVNGQEVGNLTELAQSISISLPLPQTQPQQIAGRIVYVVRSHEGKQERLASTVQNGVIRFATDQFSEFAIMSSNNLADATVDPIPDQTWTGSERTPKVRVTIMGPGGEETLREGTDYELIYTDNVEAGTATVTIKGKGVFSGTTTVTFRIVKAEAEATTPPADSGSAADGSGSTADDPGNTADSSGSVTDDSGSTADGSGSTADDPGSVTSFPATGDETPLTLYTWLLALSAGGLAAVLLRRKKQR